MGFTTVVIALFIYIIWDVNYFIRCVFTLGIAQFFQRKRKISEMTTIYGLCTTQDVDIFIRHMNNARYVRELDFARFHYYGLCGIYQTIKSMGGGAVQGASSVRYRRTIPIFSFYKITTELIWWDEKAIYLQQKFITFDGFVRAIAISKQNITKVNVMELMKKFEGGQKRPEQPEELRIWLEALEVSSKKLRKAD
ncbi:protein THEM6 [Chironomus tepperi]|uniref:protein THEM6 n=1 Tax=Chironomus tepperi TaxID=113505 RepID=UPI00391FC27D